MPRRKPPFRLKPDHYAIVAFWAVLLGEVLLPLRLLPPASIHSGSSWCGFVLILVGLGLEITVARAMTRAGTTTKPYKRPTALVTSGAFRFSRNPFYIGILLFFGGMMLMLSLDWLLLVMPLYWLALDRLVVPHEEKALAGAFGPAWDDYAARTRRWV
ncbi:methyltransferase family protein [Devosia lacusdianchii]|uniref:methyltransferase family protein n=1 Tax=Devosia lacusdianchii TaxID=2917991 RepID=UPI001F06DB3F|nr:isoprenylcysteine carboxylmethyltransferase family protein [Devosia sp. JXJ CY 41]